MENEGFRYNKVRFCVEPTNNPDEAVGHSRYVSNISTGIGIDVLERIIEKHVPFVNNERVVTRREVIRTDRYECPCCPTDITALVRVYCEGLCTKEWDEVRGLYRVSISPDNEGCSVTVRKLSDEKIVYEGKTERLPKKDYLADPKARKEIEDRERGIEELARKNPNNFLLVDGVVTGDDLGNLVKEVVEIVEEKDKK